MNEPASRLRHSCACYLFLSLLLCGVAARPASVRAKTSPEPKCNCKHASAICIGDNKCLYVVNVLNSEVSHFQREFRTSTDVPDCESAFVKYVEEQKPHPDGEPNWARFFQPLKEARIADQRLSADGVVLLRAFCENDDCEQKHEAFKNLKVELNGKTLTLESMGEAIRVAEVHDRVAKANLGDAMELKIASGSVTATRNSWYRPRNEWVIGYSLLGFGMVWPSWQMRGSPETSIVPVMMEVSWHYFKPNGSAFVFAGVGLGPNVVLSKAERDGENKSGNSAINGLIAAASVDLNGFKFGFGTRWSWLQGRFDPMITLSVTEAVARGLKLTNSAPEGLISLSSTGTK